eukprot:gene22032-biopygen7738
MISVGRVGTGNIYGVTVGVPPQRLALKLVKRYGRLRPKDRLKMKIMQVLLMGAEQQRALNTTWSQGHAVGSSVHSPPGKLETYFPCHSILRWWCTDATGCASGNRNLQSSGSSADQVTDDRF